MKKKEVKKPFFAKFLDKQVRDEDVVKGGKEIIMTYKFPSDPDERGN